jgi:uncharacterized protein (TIGR02996 family)
MRDEEELLSQLVASPADDALRLVYADWLEERGDRRAAFLRAQVSGAKPPRPSVKRALKDPQWLAKVDRTDIENCGEPQFKFRCPLKWQALAPLDEGVRYCGVCRREVFYCASLDEARQHARQGHCVAVASPIPRSPGDLEDLIEMGEMA